MHLRSFFCFLLVKTVAIYLLVVCKIFVPKIQSCKLFDKPSESFTSSKDCFKIDEDISRKISVFHSILTNLTRIRSGVYQDSGSQTTWLLWLRLFVIWNPIHPIYVFIIFVQTSGTSNCVIKNLKCRNIDYSQSQHKGKSILIDKLVLHFCLKHGFKRC